MLKNVEIKSSSFYVWPYICEAHFEIEKYNELRPCFMRRWFDDLFWIPKKNAYLQAYDFISFLKDINYWIIDLSFIAAAMRARLLSKMCTCVTIKVQK